MQSGISASAELHNAFKSFLNDTGLYALLAVIEKEALVPFDNVSSKTDLPQHLKRDQALYIILRNSDSAIIAITYVPDAAPVRSKTLFASTRLTLLRELGSEHFADSIFVTEADELTDDGWKKHQAHASAERPLTQEEKDLEGIREAEALESGGTGRRGGGYGTSKVGSKLGEGVVEALRALGSGSGSECLQIRMDVQAEQLELVGPAESVDVASLSSSISSQEPRYTFYRYSHPNADGDAPILFLYTCPSTAKPKEKMLYAASKRGVVTIAEKEAGLKLAKKLEASDPSEITVSMIQDEFAPKVEEKAGFSKPKRPGRR
ncbi:actin depolymerizing protein [Eremomyces bilateralis CBS 781.70]|uniref:Actin depolymerizing protein n=1 Tax=Eremomyces bilateralis CBS 781.70 TaxID=1392243 RepID=A0A6G1G3W3_9PEZI|nr:actin depolymerizing protein [Eremomyces bilateralis CBS 781.70]KAF1812672.1 actin depolymerizing protein [Eremomyces bilateralis CBS 781.70]